MLDVQNISFATPGGKKLLHPTSFKAGLGELIAIIGPNGAGKSTLLKSLSNQLHDASGDVFWNEANLKNLSPQEQALKRAVVAQQVYMTMEFPVREVVLMGRYPHFQKQPSKHDFEAVDWAIRQAEVEHLIDRSYNSLSGGEQQRVQIARAFAQLHEINGPGLLLLDEPLNNLDIKHQHRFLDRVTEFTKQGNTTLLVIHDINLAALYADKVAVLKNGELIAFDTPVRALTEKNLLTAYDFPVRVEHHPYHNAPAVYFGCPATAHEKINNSTSKQYQL
ncbi:heme ABC transporter ATP-binding protein [Salibacter halophilus]|uniref:Heme ABC transporter ATP-binding protein n=1 Tax=Salibacter halophilus TaxID=1803916 RepID=A0A6N6M152_9FLAO|nr:heme ABC transporter ATP-binding protein [Salibacter halophilus]KAB1062018.1 heme ABC transporter ATP-binding protein [Salibacter halophilus]